MGSEAIPVRLGWYIEIDGKMAGPFSPLQLQRMLATGEVSATQLAQRNPEGPRSGSVIQEKPFTVAQVVALINDPALNLLDALRAAREKKAPLYPSLARSKTKGKA